MSEPERLEAPSALVRYDAACRAIADAVSVDEAKNFRNEAEAMRAYARQAKNRQLEVQAAEIRLRAERRIGELMAAQKAAGMMADGGDAMRARVSQKPEVSPPTLAEAGIDKNLANRARKLAAVPENDFNGMLSDWRERVSDENEKVTVNLLAAGEREMRRKAEEANLTEVSGREAEAPDGLFDVVVIDPPWPMQKIERDVRPNQVAFDYPTMSEDELRDLPIPAGDNCHMFLWTTQKFLPMAFRLLEPWGFRYVCAFVWHKPGGFQPIGLPQYNAEFVLYARKGSPKFVDTKAFPTCFNAPRGAHSEKPSEFYEMVARVTDGRRIDMFNRRSLPGFTGWGKEAAE